MYVHTYIYAHTHACIHCDSAGSWGICIQPLYMHTCSHGEGGKLVQNHRDGLVYTSIELVWKDVYVPPIYHYMLTWRGRHIDIFSYQFTDTYYMLTWRERHTGTFLHQSSSEDLSANFTDVSLHAYMAREEHRLLLITIYWYILHAYMVREGKLVEVQELGPVCVCM